MANTRIEVQTGEVAVAGPGTILRSTAIGSCAVVALFEARTRTGGLAHILVPGRAPSGTQWHPLRYAENALDELIGRMEARGASRKRMEACIAGCANVLKRKDDSIFAENLASVTHYLSSKQIPVRKKAVGGTERRSIRFNISTGTVHFMEGDSVEKILWQKDHGKQGQDLFSRRSPAWKNR